MAEVDKCDKCKLKEVLNRAIKDANRLQEEYIFKVREVNKTLAKYTKKIEELEESNGGK